MKTECSVVRDLLPLYIEDMVSAETAQYVNEHLKNCDECQAELANFKEGWIWRKSAGTIAVYNDEDNFYYTDSVTGKKVLVTPNVAILESTYKMGYSPDYKELLTDVMLYGDYIDKRE